VNDKFFDSGWHGYGSINMDFIKETKNRLESAEIFEYKK
jgi:hypothetical protein